MFGHRIIVQLVLQICMATFYGTNQICKFSKSGLLFKQIHSSHFYPWKCQKLWVWSFLNDSYVGWSHQKRKSCSKGEVKAIVCIRRKCSPATANLQREKAIRALHLFYMTFRGCYFRLMWFWPSEQTCCVQLDHRLCVLV